MFKNKTREFPFNDVKSISEGANIHIDVWSCSALLISSEIDYFYICKVKCISVGCHIRIHATKF